MIEATDFLAQIEQRLAALEGRLSELAADRDLTDHVRKSIEIARADQPFALVKARFLLERVVDDIYRRELPEAKRKPLFDMIVALEDAGVFSKRIAADLDYIRIKGNLVLHPQGEPLEANARDVEIILLLTINLVEWYLTGYLPEPVEARGDEPPLPPNPYRGLHAFGEADAAHYFGREPDVADVLAAVERQALVAVVGASGSGKSSLAFAGIAAALRQRGDWAIAAFRPRAQPERGLARALVALWATDPVERLAQAERLAAHWAAGEVPLSEALRETRRQSGAERLLLIADQFEELYTQGLPQAQIEHFLDQLTAAVAEAAAQTTPGEAPTPCLLLTLRADFLGHALGHQGLAAMLDRYPKKLLGPISEPERLRAIIAQPAAQAGVGLEELLDERILRDLAQLPEEREQSAGASLPLLEFTLAQLWERQQERRLTHLGYEELGGIQQALARHADAVHERLDATEREQMRQILVQLVRPGEGTEDTRQVATRGQLPAEHWPLVARLADQRLIITGHDEASGEDTVELIHEALIRHWPPLRRWIDQDRAFRTWQNRLRQALADWEASGQETDALLRGTRLAEAEERLKDHRERLGAGERGYIAASLAERERAEQARRWRNRVTLVALGLGLLITTALSLWVNVEREHAEAQQDRAETGERIAVARQLAVRAEQALDASPSHLTRSALLATESLRRAPTAEGYLAWSEAMSLLPRRVVRLFPGGRVNRLEFSPDAKRLATAVTASSISMSVTSDLSNTAEPASAVTPIRVGSGGSASRVALSPNGRWLVVGNENGLMRLVDPETGKTISQWQHRGKLVSMSFDLQRQNAVGLMDRGVSADDVGRDFQQRQRLDGPSLQS